MSVQPSDTFLQFVENRRTYYNLSNKCTLTNPQLKTLVERAIKHAPTAFNMQQSRAILVTGSKHHELWELIKKTHANTLGGDVEKIKASDIKIDTMYKPGYGTVLFFEDQEVLKEWSGKMPPFTQAFHTWSDNSAGIVQFIVWTAIEAEGMGANLQHFGAYSAETQEAITKLLGVPNTWKSTALLPFGVATGAPGKPGQAKEFAAIENRVKTFFD